MAITLTIKSESDNRIFYCKKRPNNQFNSCHKKFKIPQIIVQLGAFASNARCTTIGLLISILVLAPVLILVLSSSSSSAYYRDRQGGCCEE